MAVQRKVFRIEERARRPARDAASAAETDGARRHQEFMAELQALRALIAQPAQIDRTTMERARAQIAEAQAYMSELDLIHAAVKGSKSENEAVGADASSDERIARAGCELAAIVAGTERATTAILQAAEEIGQTAKTLRAALANEPDRRLAEDIQQRVVQIFEACNFQDLTGQRVANVIAALAFIEGRVARLRGIWQGIEQFKPVTFDQPGNGGRRYLNGPRLPDDRGHSSQGDIDGMFASA
jgi:chemotaxis protein CheZ